MLYGVIIVDRSDESHTYVVEANTPEAARRIMREVVEARFVKSVDTVDFQHLLEQRYNGVALLDEVV